MTETVKFQTLPMGFCPECLDRLKAGELVDGADLAEIGVHMLHAYCAHREVGAVMFLRPGKAPRWHLQTPIDVLDWERSIAVQMHTQLTLRRGNGDTGPAH